MGWEVGLFDGVPEFRRGFGQSLAVSVSGLPQRRRRFPHSLRRYERRRGNSAFPHRNVAGTVFFFRTD